MEHKKISINMNVISVVLFLLAAAALILFGIEIHKVENRIGEQTQIEENRRQCEKFSLKLAEASDYLTSEVWHFAATQEPEYLWNYWDEVKVLKNREKAMEELRRLSLTREELELAEAAKAESDRLVGGEAWAMRLVAESAGMDKGSLPPEVLEAPYEAGEEKLSPTAKRELAVQYVFGGDYTRSKEVIQGKLETFRKVLMERKQGELDEAAVQTEKALQIARFYSLSVLFVLLLALVLYYVLMIRPFHTYAVSLKRMGDSFDSLKPRGASETRGVAEAFNQIYADWNQQKQRLEEEHYRFHVAVENSSMIVYEYDCNGDVYTACGTLTEKQEKDAHVNLLERVIPNFAEEYLKDAVSDEDFPMLTEFMENKAGGTLEMRVRPYTEASGRIWVRITSVPICDAGGNVVKLIGKITNIQKEKEREFALEKERSADRLTGFYNRDAGARRVQEFLRQKGSQTVCSMMILDMDNFEKINEEEGHTFADAVLQETADILREASGPDDVRIRLGGDEFMLFLIDCPGEQAVRLGESIARQIQKLTVGNNPNLQISASIGICGTEVVGDYGGLYRCAESALRYAKAHGKNQAASYLDTSNELGTMLTRIYPDRHVINEIDRPESSCEDLISFALDMLDKSKNLSDAVMLLMARVGKIYGVDRITIMEMDAEYLSLRFTYQWCADPADGEASQVHYISREELEEIAGAYDAAGLCSRYVIRGDYRMKSVLHAGIWDRGTYEGSMSFERRTDSGWSQEERKLLSELTKIISSYILKTKADTVSRAKTDFLSRMSHEIRTPMNAITGMTAIAKATLGDPEKTLNCLNKIESANAYLLSLINDVLDMSRIESGKVELHMTGVRLEKLLENVKSLIRPQADAKNLNFTIENLAPASLWVTADELRLSQILVNLLSNAVKFTGDGGRVTLRLDPVEQSERGISIRFSVRDTGIGISREAQDRIFNAFEQASSKTASSYGGTGLGLTISRRMVQMMGGALEVKSEPGKGAEFYFTLRLAYAQEEEAGEQREACASEQFDPKEKRLLLVEDNELNREIAEDILIMNGFEVEKASDGLEALKTFESREPYYYDAILMDIRMPVMDGVEAARRIRTSGREDARTVPIIAMTADAFDEDMKRSLDNGMNGHLSKPIDVKKLLETLQRCISKRGE